MKVRSESKTVAEVYRYHFDPMGWALFTICEATGTFSIQSDWGDYSHRWDPRHLGEPSLKHFLARGSYEYLLEKFGHEANLALAKVFDGPATMRELRKQVLERRREDCFSRQRARTLWDALAFVKNVTSTTELMHEAPHVVLDEWTDLYEYAVFRPSARWRFLRDELLPFFVGVLRAELGLDAVMGGWIGATR